VRYLIRQPSRQSRGHHSAHAAAVASVYPRPMGEASGATVIGTVGSDEKEARQGAWLPHTRFHPRDFVNR